MEYIVGKPRFKHALFLGGSYIFIAFTLFLFDAWPLIRIVSAVLVVIVIFITIPGISYSSLLWKVNDQYLEYTLHETFYEKIKAFYKHIFRTHFLEYQIKLRLDQIDYITVTYAKLPKPPFGVFGYDVLFRVHMLDGSVFTFKSLVVMQHQYFNQAVEYMKKKGIEFIDPYQILPVLYTNEHLSYYLEKLEKERGL